MSTYINIGEDQPHEWNIVPLSIYLYGVEDPQNRPIFGSGQVKHLLEERYRKKYLSEYCEHLLPNQLQIGMAGDGCCNHASKRLHFCSGHYG